MRVHAWLVVIGVAATVAVAAQEQRDKAVFAPKKDAKLDAIKSEVRKPAGVPEKNQMWIDFSAVNAPKAVSEFASVWHQPSVCQGLSGMCWCFSMTSFFESEVYRLTKREMRFSVVHSIYWEYVEKARGFVQSRGKSVFGEGSQAAAVLRAWRKHGAVPAAVYTGLKGDAKNYDHESTVYAELRAYLDGVKSAGAWNEEAVLATVRAILDSHLGVPPSTVEVDGRSLTPQQYLQQVVRINLDDYVELLSMTDKPYFQSVEYEVPDNWWHGKEYLNVPLDTFMTGLKQAIRQGYSIAIAADFSEPGYSIGAPGLAVVPTWDIPSAYIDANARHFRFANGTTTDDHGLHVVGWMQKNGKDWYLVKDSWSSAWNNDHPGYYFFHEDYVKLKVLGYLVHKDAVKGLLEKR
ncbi:MAG TPA: C1 family peptidase [Vicinamibacterales bacterium]